MEVSFWQMQFSSCLTFTVVLSQLEAVLWSLTNIQLDQAPICPIYLVHNLKWTKFGQVFFQLNSLNVCTVQHWSTERQYWRTGYTALYNELKSSVLTADWWVPRDRASPFNCSFWDQNYFLSFLSLLPNCSCMVLLTLSHIRPAQLSNA